MRARSSTLALALTLASPLAARADPQDAKAATALFQQGREAAKGGDYATAVIKMQESYKLDPAIGTLLNLADATMVAPTGPIAVDNLQVYWVGPPKPLATGLDGPIAISVQGGYAYVAVEGSCVNGVKDGKIIRVSVQ